MAKHSHEFVEKYTGLVGFGLDRETDEYSITYYVQKFSDDELMKLLRSRMSNSDIQALADMLISLLKTYLSNQEYHRYFLKDEDQEENT